MEATRWIVNQTAISRVDTSHAIHSLIPFPLLLVSLPMGDILVLTLHLGVVAITTIGEEVEVDLGVTTLIQELRIFRDIIIMIMTIHPGGLMTIQLPMNRIPIIIIIPLSIQKIDFYLSEIFVMVLLIINGPTRIKTNMVRIRMPVRIFTGADKASKGLQTQER